MVNQLSLLDETTNSNIYQGTWLTFGIVVTRYVNAELATVMLTIDCDLLVTAMLVAHVLRVGQGH